MISLSGSSGGSGGSYDPTDAASSTPGNSLFTKALPPCAFGTVTARFDFSLFKEVCYCHQGLYLITERHQREMKHSGESLEGAFWRKVASSLGWEWLLKFLFLCRPAFFFLFFLPPSLLYLFIFFLRGFCVISFAPYRCCGKIKLKSSPSVSARRGTGITQFLIVTLMRGENRCLLVQRMRGSHSWVEDNLNRARRWWHEAQGGKSLSKGNQGENKSNRLGERA